MDGTTVSDSDPAAVHQQRSVTLSLVPLMVDDVKVNLMDTPGYPDFIGEIRAGLRASDAALFVVSAVDGIDATTTALWGECEHVRLPRALVITRMDHPRAVYDGTLAACQRAAATASCHFACNCRGKGRTPVCWGCCPARSRTTRRGTPRPQPARLTLPSSRPPIRPAAALSRE